MIEFRQKSFTEYDAMRSLYVELCRRGGDRQKWRTIDKTSLLPVLKGNNVVIERFVISTSFLNRDRYRIYLKVGAKAKMPDEVRLPEQVYDKSLGNVYVKMETGPVKFPKDLSDLNNNQNQNNGGKKQKQDKNNNGFFRANYDPRLDIKYEVRELLGDTIKYSKKERSLVLEFPSINKAIDALNVLPFGIDYNIYLLV